MTSIDLLYYLSIIHQQQTPSLSLIRLFCSYSNASRSSFRTWQMRTRSDMRVTCSWMAPQMVPCRSHAMNFLSTSRAERTEKREGGRVVCSDISLESFRTSSKSENANPFPSALFSRRHALHPESRSTAPSEKGKGSKGYEEMSSLVFSLQDYSIWLYG